MFSNILANHCVVTITYVHFLIKYELCELNKPLPDLFTTKTGIRDFIKANLDKDGRMDFARLREILYNISFIFEEEIEVPSAEELTINYEYSNDQVHIYLLSFSTEATPKLNKLVIDMVAREMGEVEELDFNQVRAICMKLAERPEDFDSIDVFKRRASELANRFNKQEVLIVVRAFAAIKEPGLNATIETEIQKYNDRDVKEYEEFKNIFLNVKHIWKKPMKFFLVEECRKTYTSNIKIE
ncbi:uncharacterized protein LOC126837986 [Adelges cooleyi]|uniref:uncharacterized protein LOC126837986 n=1 Tax=Adelges cooleyi TaxID=133065 RepID=UPI0021808B16|nr:uncharacterized protein LOC126837986 [Adelges cooleyi]